MDPRIIHPITRDFIIFQYDQSTSNDPKKFMSLLPWINNLQTNVHIESQILHFSSGSQHILPTVNEALGLATVLNHNAASETGRLSIMKEGDQVLLRYRNESNIVKTININLHDAKSLLSQIKFAVNAIEEAGDYVDENAPKPFYVKVRNELQNIY